MKILSLAKISKPTRPSAFAIYRSSPGGNPILSNVPGVNSSIPIPSKIGLDMSICETSSFIGTL